MGLLVALSLVVTPTTTSARSLIVPEDAPTIHAALDSIAAGVPIETVLVRPGIEPEEVYVNPNVARVVLIGLTEFPNAAGRPLAPQTPTLSELVAYNNVLTVRNIHVAGPTVAGSYDCLFYDCQLDSGLTTPYGYTQDVRLVSCTLYGQLTYEAIGVIEVDSCTIHGKIVIAGEGLATVSHSIFTGPSDWAIAIAHEGPFTMTENTIRGCGNGIGTDYAGKGGSIINNIIEDCPGVGIHAWTDTPVDLIGNHVQGCSTGVSASGGSPFRVKDNTVTHCKGDGMMLWLPAGGVVDSNVVGLSGGNGLVISGATDYGEPAVLRNNTSFWNGGSGFVIYDHASDRASHVSNNIGCRNGGYGLLSAGDVDPTSTCNDWFANDSSNVGGMDPSSEDLVVPPDFCDVAHGDVHLSAGSLLLNADVIDRCGQIGALWLGCDVASTPTRIRGVGFAATVVPNPLRGAGTLNLTLTRPGRVRMEILDVQGRRVAMPLDATLDVGLHPIALRARQLHPGVYLYRLRGPEGEITGRFVVVE